MSTTLGTDTRSDPRMIAALAPFGLDAPAPQPPVTRASSRDVLLQFAADTESGFEALFDALMAGLPPVEDVVSEVATTTASDGTEIRLHVHRPATSDGSLPCVYHVHGGGGVVLSAETSSYVRWRDELAATGVVVVGVEFRNGAGKLGPYPFPTGLEDCAAGLRWVADHRRDLGAANVVVSGDSGGANLSLALAIKAKREGWVQEISGVYGQCPYIHGAWANQGDGLASLRENDGYLMAGGLLEVLAEVYDPGGAHAQDPTCWPFHATAADLEGLPPHVISVSELDPLRDEGIAYHHKLLAAEVDSTGRMNLGVCHIGEVLFRATLPELYAANVRDIAGFARSRA